MEVITFRICSGCERKIPDGEEYTLRRGDSDEFVYCTWDCLIENGQ